MRRGAAIACLLWAAACSETRDRFLPVPLPLASSGGVLRALGGAEGEAALSCDEAQRDLAPGAQGPVLIDSGTPLSAFRGEPGEAALRFDRGRVFLSGAQGDAAGPTRLMLCDVPILRASQSVDQFQLRWGDAALPAAAVLGGDLLGRFSLLFSFGAEPDQPLCAKPPCLRFGRSDLASSCRLASRGEAVFPFKPLGGELLVKLGDDLIQLPPTRITVAACAEPAADPLGGAEPAPCLPCDRLDARRQALGADIVKNRCRIQQLEELFNLICKPAPARTCPDGFRLPAPQPTAECPSPQSYEDLIAEQELHDPRYQASGKNMRLLVSTALPGLLLSRSAYARLRDEAAAEALFSRPGVPLQMPGFPVETARRVTLGRAGAAALALVSRELQLSPCEELARSRRQRYGLPRVGDGACTQSCAQSACLVNLQRDSIQTQRRCGYAGQNAERACDDLQSPVAAVVELDGPVGDSGEVMVAEDYSPIFQSVNNELRSTSAQVDGILGVAMLSRLQAELDYPGQRLAAHCRCGEPGCRAYRRFTYQAVDDCAEQTSLCLPQTGGPAPGAIAPTTCR